MTDAHHFAFSTRRWAGLDRLCKQCLKPYAEGEHIEITNLEPYTSYVCPTGDGYGHSSIYTGAHRLELRRPDDHLCVCGEEFVKEDKETWQLTWEMSDGIGPWRTVSAIRTRHAGQQQREGLQILIERGELIRNIEFVQLKAASA